MATSTLHTLRTVDSSEIPNQGNRISPWEQMLLAPLIAGQAALECVHAGALYGRAVDQYSRRVTEPLMASVQRFFAHELDRGGSCPPAETIEAYRVLAEMNQKTFTAAMRSVFDTVTRYQLREFKRLGDATVTTFFGSDGPNVLDYWRSKRIAFEHVTERYPRAIEEIKPHFGFHLDRDGYDLVAETPRFQLYRVYPTDPSITVSQNAKPMIVIPPYVLGANILAFLPNEGKSYVHAHANSGIPTYIRITRNIEEHVAVQRLTPEEDALDTRRFCEQLFRQHGQPATINGYCQGGFIAAVNILSGKLAGVVDTLITCVTPLDGTKTPSFRDYISAVPALFLDLSYSLTRLPNGNPVIDAETMALVYKLKSFETEAPILALYRDLLMFDTDKGLNTKISSTAAALNHWLLYDKTHLPPAISELSMRSFTNPVAADGTMPVELFGRRLNLRDLRGHNVLICIADRDDMVAPESALIAAEHAPVTVKRFSGGHVKIATSHAQPGAEEALHVICPERGPGPVAFHLANDRSR